jgi:beta-lactamase regulating signal transducer with metallopeptidase domain
MSHDLLEWMLALGIAVKATLVLGAAGLVAVALSRSSAAARHLVWLLALGGVGVVPLLMPVAPTLRVPLPVATFIVDLPAPQTLGSTAATVPQAPGVESRVITAAPPTAEVARSLASPSTAFIVTVIWLLGCAVVITRCVVAHVAVARLVRASERVTGARWQRLVDDAATRTGVRRHVTVMCSAAVGGPITSGLIHPVVLLPRDAETWTDERREVVLLHEMAHVGRFDYAAQLIATAACTLYWFHPAVWIAAARMRLEAEHAADDRVLTAGLPSVRYATHLVDLARRAAIGEPAAVAVGIAHRTHIERRVSAMLDTTRSRAAVSPRTQSAVAATMLVMLIPLAGIRTEAAATESMITVSAAAPTPALAPAMVRASAPAVPVGAPASDVAAKANVQRIDSAFEKTIDAASGGRVVLDLDTGGAVQIHGWDQPRVRVRVRLAGPNWRDTRVELEKVSDGVRLGSEFDRRLRSASTSHEFELWVPRQSDIEVSSSGGGLAIEDVEGRFRGHTGGGEIDVRRSSGRSSLSTGGGNVTVSQSNLSGTVSTGGGSVILSRVTGGLRGSSGSGPVMYAERPGGQRGRFSDSRDTTADLSGMTITSNRIVTTDGRGDINSTVNDVRGLTQNVPRELSIGALHITKAGGHITLDAAPQGGIIHTGGGRIVIGRAGGDLRASTGGGDIEIQSITGSADVSTGAGDVHLTIVGDDGREQVIEAWTGHGTVEIVVPRSFNGRVELEAAYTRGFGRKSRIETDWTIEQTETDEWESPNGGTPRKYVRATGVLGNGRGLIRIGTVNGDVVLRRAR